MNPNPGFFYLSKICNLGGQKAKLLTLVKALQSSIGQGEELASYMLVSNESDPKDYINWIKEKQNYSQLI